MAIQRPRAAGAGDKLDLEANVGRLLLVWPKSHETGIKTNYGEKEAIKADVLLLDAPTGAVLLQDVLLFGLALIGQLKGSVGTPYDSPVIGVVARGEAKPGQAAPWELHDDEITDRDIEEAEAWLRANGPKVTKVSQQPTPATPAPAAGPRWPANAPDHGPDPAAEVTPPAAPPAAAAPAAPAAPAQLDIAAVAAQVKVFDGLKWTDDQILTNVPGLTAPALAAVRAAITAGQV